MGDSSRALTGPTPDGRHSKITLGVPFPVALCTRSKDGSAGGQTLVFSNDRDGLFSAGSGVTRIYELLGVESGQEGPVRLGRAIELKERGPDGDLRPYNCQVAVHRAVYDTYSNSVYFVEGRALMRLGPDDVVAPLAGHRELCGGADGPGLGGARFQLPHSLASDGAGCLYLADGGTVRRVRLPRPADPPGTEAEVTTVYGGVWSSGFVDVAFDASQGVLYAATHSAVYRLPEDGSVPARVAGSDAPPTPASAPMRAHAHAPAPPRRGGRGGGADRAGAAAAPPAAQANAAPAPPPQPDGFPALGFQPAANPLGLGAGAGAGADAAGGGGGGGPLGGAAGGGAGGGGAAAAAARGRAGAAGGGAAGALAGSSAGCSFSGVSGLVADGEGRLVVADRQQVVRLAPGGGVEAVVSVGKGDTSWGAVGCYPCVLPNGWLALCQYHDRRVLLLRMGLRPAGAAAQRLAWHEGLPGLVTDLARLLACPDGSDDVTLVVGGSAFRCHRLILGARCAYFRRLFAGGFADSGAREVVLQDADPEAFQLLLTHLYTGDLAFPPHTLRAVAELADRLLLPEVTSFVHRRLLASTAAGSVVGDMLWAYRMGFADLLAGYKDWYLAHQPQVLAAAPEAVRDLCASAPGLMFDLHCETVSRGAGGTCGAGALRRPL
ncbi:hypothetical protein HYH03_001270 [Edaphochlamys debaryana]|uniref:BTB domain-containing protein n=1 Tax=Edaphochlamys debaryana TaxID=47281 RepID=A0A835YCQ9_9CHLO|nr:hypothetical protein HYH03_001270 [Edaphochlamys debaryana]|eukprot:KAG2500490.1 hypothetical protein HYH03_001270 [Edaphochlamys debaryana]